MEIGRSQAIELFQALGFKAAETWSKDRMMNRIMALNNATDQDQTGDPVLDALLDDIISAVNSGEPISLVKHKADEPTDEDIESDENGAAEAELDEEDDSDLVPVRKPAPKRKLKTKKGEAVTKTKKAVAANGEAKAKTKTKKTKDVVEEKAAKKAAKVTKATKEKVTKATKEKVTKATKEKAAKPAKEKTGKDEFGARIGTMANAVNQVVISKLSKKNASFRAQDVSAHCDVDLSRIRVQLRQLTKVGHLKKTERNTFQRA